MPRPPGGQRLDYDTIAHLYDSQPLRAKQPDEQLGAFLEERGLQSPRALDLGCGTGNQQVANRAAFPEARLFGADLFLGMLLQAARKTREVDWTQADGAALPFRDGAFDYVSDQFSLHHVLDKPGLFREVRRVLAPGGRFVLQNVCPEGMRDRALYRYFPAILDLDARDHLSAAEHVRLLEEAGFDRVRHALDRRELRRPLAEFRAYVGRRDVTSELLAIRDADYAAGLQKLDEALAAGTRELDDSVCLLTVWADRAV